jgi:hypothetical protein
MVHHRMRPTSFLNRVGWRMRPLDLNPGEAMQRPITTAQQRRGAFALLAVLGLWLQIVVPGLLGTVRLLAHEQPHHAAHASHHHHEGESAPGLPGEGHHLGLCCILTGKFGTGFAPPASAGSFIPAHVPSAAPVTYRPNVEAHRRDRPVLPLGARAPPRFA